MKMRSCNLVEFLYKSVIGEQYVCFKHGEDRTKFVRCMDFISSFEEFTKDNPAMNDHRFLPKVQKASPMMCKCADGEERVVLIIELKMKNTMVWHCANCVEAEDDESRPLDEE